MSSASNAATFSGSVGSQGRPRVLDHVVEGEQAAHGRLGRGDPPVANAFGTERAVDAARAYPADLQISDRLLGDQPSVPQGLHEAERREAADPEPRRKLRGRLAKATHSARRPVKPNGSSAFSRPCRWWIIKAAVGRALCFA